MSVRENYVSDLRDNRIHNTARVAIANVISVIISTVGPFLTRTVMIDALGDEYVGVNSIFISIITLLNMAELGLSSVIIYFLYEPMALGNAEETGKYVNELKKIYKYIGLFVLIIGLIVTPILPKLSKDPTPEDINIYASFIVLLVATSLQYFIAPETITIANAAQRGNISAVLSIIGNSVLYFLQIIVIICFKSFELYYVVLLINCVLFGVARIVIRKKKFGYIRSSGELNSSQKNDIRKRVVALIGHQMNTAFLASIDKVVISGLLGLVIVTQYDNYMLVLSAATMFLVTVMQALTASLGNALVTEEKAANYERFRATLWLTGVVVAWMTACLLCLIQPFMKVWMGKRVFPFGTVLLFCTYFFSSEIRVAVITFKNAGGLWSEDKYKPYVSMAANFLLDVILVHIMGVNGVLIATIICQIFIETPWEGKVLIGDYFGKSVWQYMYWIIKCFICTAFFSGVMYWMCSKLVVGIGICNVLLRGLLITIIYAIMIFVLFHNDEEFRIWSEAIHLLIKDKR